MHLETTHPQCLVPRLPQRLVRGYAVKSVLVLQAATDQRADQTANGTANGAAHGAADTGCTTQLALRRLVAAAISLCAAAAGCSAQLVLRRLVAAAIGLCAAPRLRAARRWRGRRWWRGFMFISVWHDPIS
jgi:hypothetical protein